MQSKINHLFETLFFHNLSTKPWYKRKRYIAGIALIILVLALIIIVASILGTRNRSSNPNSLANQSKFFFRNTSIIINISDFLSN